MTALGQIVLRNLSAFEPDQASTWINPPDDDSWKSLSAQAGQLALHCQNFGSWNSIVQSGGEAVFGAFPENGPFGQVLLSLPHSKARLDMMLDYSASLLEPDGVLWLAGENRAGIRSAVKRLKSRFQNVQTVDSARHCRLYRANMATAANAFLAEDYIEQWDLDCGTKSLKLCSLPGVFAHGRLDEGTRLLLGVIPDLEFSGRILDFGSGCGVIAACVARHHNPSKLVLTDVDALALQSAGMTMEVNNIVAEVIPGNGLEGLQGPYDLVVSNPPFHDAHVTKTDLSMNLLKPVRNFLAPGGSVVLVVNRHLPYIKWLDGVFGSHRVLAENTRFQVLQATRTH